MTLITMDKSCMCPYNDKAYVALNIIKYIEVKRWLLHAAILFTNSINFCALCAHKFLSKHDNLFIIF
jgi:hypothetical protein